MSNEWPEGTEFCSRPASKFIVFDASPDGWTVSCDEHLAAMNVPDDTPIAYAKTCVSDYVPASPEDVCCWTSLVGSGRPK